MSASVTHLIPLMRDALATLGSREVGRAAVAHALGKGESIALVPGGQAEMFLSRSKISKGADAVYIIRRHNNQYKGTPNQEGWLEKYTYY